MTTASSSASVKTSAIAAQTTNVPPTRDISAQLALAILEGFSRHYQLFRSCARAAKTAFEEANWLTLQHLSRERIDFYDRRVVETVQRVERDFRTGGFDDDTWQRVKLNYIGLLSDYPQPELAETFFNSVSCQVLHRQYFNNRFLFVRPAISTDYLAFGFPDQEPTYRCYYPNKQGLRAALMHIVVDFGLRRRFADFRRDLINILKALRAHFTRPLALDGNFQVQVLGSLFYRNKAAYIVGRVINGSNQHPFAVPIRHDKQGLLYLDALLLTQEHLDLLFSSYRAYFLVDMAIPSAYVDFLSTVLMYKPRAEIYTMLGLQKQGKNLFYRDFLHHLKHSTDDFIPAPGIKGLVMCVFALPSYPYVFKVIMDKIAPSKDTDRARVMEKYQLVKHHDRMGRMADSLEYSDVAFPKNRFTPALLEELKDKAASLIEDDGERIIIRHLYIERRLVPLNIYLNEATDEQRRHALREYGLALKQLAAVNIFAGDLLFKNFGVSRYNRVVFYDYDEIDYLTNCNFRHMPKPPPGYDEMSNDVWYPVGPHDIFPEEFATFLLGDPGIRTDFLAQHADLLDADYWCSVQAQIKAGHIEDEFPYPDSVRFLASVEGCH